MKNISWRFIWSWIFGRFPSCPNLFQPKHDHSTNLTKIFLIFPVCFFFVKKKFSSWWMKHFLKIHFFSECQENSVFLITVTDNQEMRLARFSGLFFCGSMPQWVSGKLIDNEMENWQRKTPTCLSVCFSFAT